MNDPAKTEARKGATVQKNAGHKLGVLLRGKAHVYAERIMYEEIQYLAWAIENRKSLIEKGQHTEKDLRASYNAAVKWAQDSLAGAIIDNDVAFFERMADLARLKMDGGLIRAGKVIDEKAAHVVAVVLALRREKRSVTAYRIAKRLNERWPKTPKVAGYVKGDSTPIMEGGEWSAREVLTIMGTVGIKSDKDTKKRLVSSR